MDGKRPADALTDSELDRELEAAFGVEPSPEFVARVRTRVAAEPAPSWGGGRWLLPAAAAASAAIALLVAISLPGGGVETSPGVSPDTVVDAPASRRTPDNSDATRSRVAGTVTPAEPTVAAVGPAPSDRRKGRGPVPGPARQVAERPFPEVVISTEERRAFALLLTSIAERRLPPVPEDVVAEGRALEAMPLDILPLVIEPLAPVGRVE